MKRPFKTIILKAGFLGLFPVVCLDPGNEKAEEETWNICWETETRRGVHLPSPLPFASTFISSAFMVTGRVCCYSNRGIEKCTLYEDVILRDTTITIVYVL